MTQRRRGHRHASVLSLLTQGTQRVTKFQHIFATQVWSCQWQMMEWQSLFEAKSCRGRDEKQVGKRLLGFAFLLNLGFQLIEQLVAKFFVQDMTVSFYMRAADQQTGFFWLIIKICVHIK